MVNLNYVELCCKFTVILYIKLTILKKPEHFEEHNLCQELEKCCTPFSSGDSDGSSSHSAGAEMLGDHW